jgi:hypothetical protein
VFEEFMGIPVHPLLVHAAVVFVPLLALTAVVYALVPSVRAHVRLVLAGLAVITPGAALFAKLSGDEFFARLSENGSIGGDVVPKVEAHRDLGNLTLYATIGLAVVTLALVYFVAPRSRVDATGNPGPRRTNLGGWLLTALTVVAAGISLYYVVRTGDSGAKAVWTGF